MENFKEVFSALKEILLPYAEKLDCESDSDERFYLNTRHVMKNGQPLFFGSAEIKKNYVSYYLMPVYVNPELLGGISPELKKRMQGKSCFNFKKPEPELFEELAELTEKGYQDYRRQGYL